MSGRTVRFTVAGNPVPQGSMRRARRGKLMHSNSALLPWREQVGLQAQRARQTHKIIGLLEGPIELDVEFRLLRPKSVKRAMPTVPPDLDKLVRSIGDALSGIIFKNDAQIVHINAWKHYACTPSMSGCGIRVSEIE